MSVYRCLPYHHRTTRTKLFCFLFLFFSAYTRNKNCLQQLNVYLLRSWEHLCHLLIIPLLHATMPLVLNLSSMFFTKSYKCNPNRIKRFSLGIWTWKWYHLQFVSFANPTFSLFHFAMSKFTPPPTQFWCSSLTTVIFVATTVTTSAEEKIGDMMAFPLSQLRAQSSPTSHISMHSCQGVRLWWKCLTRGMR